MAIIIRNNGNRDDERAGRLERTLEELRLNTQDLHELARQAMLRAQADRDSCRLMQAGTTHA